jgi:hypothetical protein
VQRSAARDEGNGTFMTDSSEALSKGLPLNVVISPLGMLTCCFRLGTTNLQWGEVTEKLRAAGLVG